MKRLISRFFLLAALAAACIGCHPGGSLPSTCRETHWQTDTLQHLFGDATKPACQVVIDLTTIRSLRDNHLRDTLNSLFLSHSLGEEYAGLEGGEAVRRFAYRYGHEYRTDVEPLYTEEATGSEGQDVSAWFQYYLDIRTAIHRFTDSLLVYEIRRETYTGGAHGLATADYLNIALADVRLLRLDDVIRPDCRQAVTDLLWKHLARQEKVSSREELEAMGYGFGNGIEPSETFILEADRLTFVYNPYDIAPYSMGRILISIPLDELKPYLQPGLPGA